MLADTMQLIMRPVWELAVLMLASLLPQASAMKMPWLSTSPMPAVFDSSYCLSWRVGVEANNVRCFHTVPAQCISYIEKYMLGGQYGSDVEMVVEQILAYLNETTQSDDGKDAWVLDVDDTCISNLMYYETKHFG